MRKNPIKIDLSSEKQPVLSFCSLLLLQKKKFEVRAVQDGKAVKKSFYTGSAERSRQLLLLCSSAHQFVLSLGPRLLQLRREQEEGNTKTLHTHPAAFLFLFVRGV
jgi:hypothetical protein